MGEKLTPEQVEALRRFAERQTEKAIREKEDSADLRHNNYMKALKKK